MTTSRIVKILASEGPPSNYFNMIQSSKVARMSCDRATVKVMKNKLITYRDLRQGLIASREEFDRSTEWEDAANAGLMALQWTKASCDAFISMAAAASSALLPNNTAGFVKGSYAAATAVAEAGSTAFHGGKVDNTALVRDIKDGLVDMAGQKLGPVSGIANLYVNITIDAVRGDDPAVLLQATAGQLSETAKLAAEWAAQLDKQGQNKAALGLASVVDIATAGVKYSAELNKASEAYLNTSDEIASRRRSIHRTLSSQLKRIETRVAQLESALDECIVPTLA